MERRRGEEESGEELHGCEALRGEVRLRYGDDDDAWFGQLPCDRFIMK